MSVSLAVTDALLKPSAQTPQGRTHVPLKLVFLGMEEPAITSMSAACRQTVVMSTRTARTQLVRTYVSVRLALMEMVRPAITSSNVLWVPTTVM